MLFGIGRHRVLISVQAQLVWTVFHDLRLNRWVAACDPLNITVSATSENDLRVTIAEAIDGLFTDLFEAGELESFLAQNAWTTADPLPKPHRTVPVFQLPEPTVNRARSAEELLANA